MPPTVKSLDERIDEMAASQEELAHQVIANNAKLDLLSSQIAPLVTNQSATQNQLAVLVVKLDGTIEQLKLNNVRLDKATDKLDALTADHVAVKTKSELIETQVIETASKLETVAAEHVALKTKADTTFAMMKWIGVSAFGVLATVILSGFTVARFAGNLETAVQQQQKMLDQQQKTLEEIKRDVSEIRNKK